MKIFIFFAAIFLFSACSSSKKNPDDVLKVRENYENAEPGTIEVTFQDGWFKLLNNGLEISSIRKSSFIQGNLKVNQGRARVNWKCDLDFKRSYPEADNYKCVVDDYTVGFIIQHPTGRRIVNATEGGGEVACYGFSEGRRMSCDEYDKSHALRHEKARYIYRFRQAENLNNYWDFINSYSRNDLGGLVPLAIERQSKIDKSKNESNKALTERLKKERAEKIALIKKYRLELKPGDESNCGLVVDVKRPIVSIQSMNGLVWLKIEEIYPIGMVDCEFYNNEYLHRSPF